jgi:adenosylhomocysteine nucleosidase
LSRPSILGNGSKFRRSEKYFLKDFPLPGGGNRRVVVLHGGWGKVSAAGSTQYVIDRWNPGLLINFGTCGGFEGAIDRGAVILVERTVIYDIIERMGDAEEAVRDYATSIDLGWMRPPFPTPVIISTLVSADQDLDPAAIPNLKSKYGAAAGDWESGAIAYIAKKNNKRLLILRGVTDLVGARGGEAYGKIEVFRCNTETIMKRLFADLPAWLEKAKAGN